MSNIDNGIKQPLRFYDSVDRQNWRKRWANDAGLTDLHVLLCPENAILPFQVRRRRAISTVTTFDLWTYDAAAKDFVLDYSIFTVIPAPLTNHLRVIQMQNVDNIVWYPTADFTTPMDCGLHYIHLSDGANHWYSEVFSVIEGFDDTTKEYATGLTAQTIAGTNRISRDGTSTSLLIRSEKPF